MNILLSRDDFRETVFQRDNWKCVICNSPAADAHHILERRLFDNGGYYVDNGASLCPKCHVCAEETDISCEEIRTAAGITNLVMPEHFYDDVRYDKWGNIFIDSSRRLRGELFYDQSVQKIIKNVLPQFSEYVKYPRTFHLPWSIDVGKDDRVLRDTSSFVGKNVIVSLKMDGENTTLYHDYIHARSLDSRNHPSRNWVKNYHSKFSSEIPEGWRVCGENLYAEHSIHYKSLESFFLAFSVWDNRNFCLSWDETEEYSALLGIKTVPVLYRGIWDEEKIRAIHKQERDGDQCEGYVVRLSEGFSYGGFRKSVAKYVRKGHLKTTHHWMSKRIIKNELKQ